MVRIAYKELGFESREGKNMRKKKLEELKKRYVSHPRTCD